MAQKQWRVQYFFNISDSSLSLNLIFLEKFVIQFSTKIVVFITSNDFSRLVTPNIVDWSKTSNFRTQHFFILLLQLVLTPQSVIFYMLLYSIWSFYQVHPKGNNSMDLNQNYLEANDSSEWTKENCWRTIPDFFHGSVAWHHLVERFNHSPKRYSHILEQLEALH